MFKIGDIIAWEDYTNRYSDDDIIDWQYAIIEEIYPVKYGETYKCKDVYTGESLTTSTNYIDYKETERFNRQYKIDKLLK